MFQRKQSISTPSCSLSSIILSFISFCFVLRWPPKTSLSSTLPDHSCRTMPSFSNIPRSLLQPPPFPYSPLCHPDQQKFPSLSFNGTSDFLVRARIWVLVLVFPLSCCALYLRRLSYPTNYIQRTFNSFFSSNTSQQVLYSFLSTL